MLSSSCCIRAFNLCGVKFLSRLLTALNLLPVDGHYGIAKQPDLATQLDELAADSANRFAVIPTEVGDGLEVGRQSTSQPHQFDVALRLALQPTAGWDPVQIPIDVNLEEHRRVVCRPSCLGWRGPRKSQFRQIKFFNEGIDRPDRIVFGDPILQPFGKQD